MINTSIEFADDYFKRLGLASRLIDLKDLDQVVSKLGYARKIFVAGNGGSAAISNHLCCDFVKQRDLAVESLAANQSMLTMIGNDFGFDQIFSYQVEKFCTNADVLFLISSSGNSQNIIRACAMAQVKQTFVVGMTGFDGGKLKQMAGASFHVPSDNYGIIEDCHQSLMHIISQCRRKNGT